MAITLNFASRTAGLTAINIYRASAPIDRTNLPAPLTTLSGSATTYTDNDPVRNTLYYYTIGSVKNGVEVLSREYALAYMPYTGVGPSALVFGDYKDGYFGKLDPTLCPTADDINTAFGTSFTKATIQPLWWHKFAIDGKILFIPGAPIIQVVSYGQLYAAGLLFGINDTCKAFLPTAMQTGTLVNQYKTLTKGSDQFIVRAHRQETNQLYASLADFTAKLTKNDEWTRTIERLYETAAVGSIRDGVSRHKWDSRPITEKYRLGNATYALQSAAFGTGVINRSDATTAEGIASTTSSGNSGMGFLPVFELIF